MCTLLGEYLSAPAPSLSEGHLKGRYEQMNQISGMIVQRPSQTLATGVKLAMEVGRVGPLPPK